MARIHIRPPGVKTGSTIGPLGPFRGRLGISWVVASVAAALVILMVGTWFLFRPPPPPFQRVPGVAIDDIAAGTARKVLPNVFVGRSPEGSVFAVAQDPQCPLLVVRRGYRDCTSAVFGWDGRPINRPAEPLALVPLEIHRGELYVRPLD